MNMDNIIICDKLINSRYSIDVRSCLGGRKEQQDYAFVNLKDDHAFVVVCDGMGDSSSGQAASELTISSMIEEYEENASKAIQNPKDFLHDAIIKADKMIYNKKIFRGRGTTLVSVLIDKYNLYWASAGDSRLYIYRNGQIIQATRDHNFLLMLNELAKEGLISNEEYNNRMCKAEALISYIGIGNIEVIDITNKAFVLEKGDKLLLMTDGLYKVVSDGAINKIIMQKESVNKIGDLLVNELNNNCSIENQDNTTFVIIEIN